MERAGYTSTPKQHLNISEAREKITFKERR